MAAGPPSPPVLHAHFNATTTSGDSRLILVSLHVAGAERPLRALLDSGATNNFLRDDCLALLPSHVRVRDGPGDIVVKLADGKSHRVPRRAVSLSYEFDGFSTKDDFLVIEMNYAFDCILGMPWLSRHQPEIDWLARSVRRRVGYDVSEVFTHLLVAPTAHVAVVDRTSTTQSLQHVSDGPRCEMCATTTTGRSSASSSRVREDTRTNAVEQRLPHVNATVEQRLPFADDSVAQTHGLRDTGVVETELPRLAGGEVSSSESSSGETSASSSGSRRLRKSKRNRSGHRRLRRSSPAADLAPPREVLNVVEYAADSTNRVRSIAVANPPSVAASITRLPGLSWKHFLRDLKAGEVEQVCLLTNSDPPAEIANAIGDDEMSSRPKAAELKSAREERFAAQSWTALKASGNPVYTLAKEFADVFPEKIPAELPAERGVRHEIDLVPGSKYCVTRQWPLPKDQVQAIDDFFEGRRKAGHVRESISPHSSPTFCVKKATGGWRIVHAFNKLNDVTIPAQTPIPRKDMILDTMSGSVIYSAIDLTDGFYQILMRTDDIPLTAVSTPSGMLWEWLVMPQGLKNAPATFNRMVSHVLRPLRAFAPSYFDDIFVHSRAEDGLSAVDVHLRHLRQVFEKMRENKLYANLKKCVFCAPEIPVLGCYVSKDGVRADPEKISSICSWPTPKNQTELRQWLGLANYLHKYTKDYAGLIQPMSSLLKKDVAWDWRPVHQDAFEAVKKSLASAPVLMLPDTSRPFHVVCDASDFAIGCALMQFDDEGRERVVSYQSRQMKPAEKNYPVHDKELLAMRYALIKFRVYLLGEQTFAVYTDHASLRTAMKSPHLSQRMARWLSFFAEYNFVVHYKPGKNNILADALSRRPDYDPRRETRHQDLPDDDDDDEDCAVCTTMGINATVSSPVLPLRQQVADAYEEDAFYAGIIRHLRDPTSETLAKLTRPTRDAITRYDLDGDLLTYAMDTFDTPRVVIPADDDLRARLVHEYHDAPSGGHLGREKTFAALSRDFFWPRMYKWIRKWVRSCETCQRVKPTASRQAPLRPLPIATSAWRSVSMDYIFGLPRDAKGRTGVLVFVDRFSKMVHLAPVTAEVTAAESAQLFLDLVFRYHGLPESIVSDRDPRFTSAFWTRLFELLGTRLLMSTAAHPETDGQTERTNRVVEDVLRSYATSFGSWSSFLPMAEFALNNATHSSTGLTPFFVNNARHPRVPALLAVRSTAVASGSSLGGGGKAPTSQSAQTSSDNPLPASASSVTMTPDEGHALYGVAYDDCFDERTVTAAAAVGPDTANFAPKSPPTPIDSAAVSDFLLHRQAVTRFVRDALQAAVDKQKENADRRGRKNMSSFRRGERVLLSTEGIQGTAVTNLGANKLAPRFIGPFKILKVIGDAYTLDIPTAMRLHPTFYVGRLKPYVPASIPASADLGPSPARSRRFPCDAADAESARVHDPPASALPSAGPRRRASPSAAGEPSCRAAPAPNVPQQLPQPGHDQAQTPRDSARPSLRPSTHPPPPSSTGTGPSSTAPTSQPARSHSAQQQPRYQRDGPPPLVDTTGAQRWIVDRLVDHDMRENRELRPRDASSARTRASRRAPTEKHYRVRWLGHSPAQDTWEPRTRLLEDVPDLVSDYEASLALVSASDRDAEAHRHHPANGSSSDLDEKTSPARHDDCHESPPLQHRGEPGRIGRSSDVRHRSAATAQVGAPTRRASDADAPRRIARSPQRRSRSTDATRALRARRRASEDLQ